MREEMHTEFRGKTSWKLIIWKSEKEMRW